MSRLATRSCELAEIRALAVVDLVELGEEGRGEQYRINDEKPDEHCDL